MKTILKYPLPLFRRVSIPMPKGAEILDVQVQNGAPQVWALVDRSADEYEAKALWVFGTGRDVDTDELVGDYVATFQLEGGAMVYHVFEEKKQ